MTFSLFPLSIIGFVLVSLCLGAPNDTTGSNDWWKTAQFYQIYPRSFKDSNGDGIGDLIGITQKLDHLKDIGITAAWLSPIFKSPMVDFGYDISDFYSIQPEYGTMQDFDNLMKRANQLGIKIILDFVPNHSSDKNEWFIKSVNKEKGYEDFYIWNSGKPDPNNSSRRIPPNNWLSSFRGSAWEWNDKRKQFYYHQFAVQQPDFNYRNPIVIEHMSEVLKFWLNKGVAGFRVDAVPTIFEVPPSQNGSLPDEPRSGLTNDTQNSDYLKHIYTQDQPETIELIYRARDMLDEYQKQNGGDSRVFLAETYSDIKTIMQYYGNGTRNGAHIPFNFNFLQYANEKSNARDLENVINLWMDNMPKGYTPNWVMGNHDRPRVGSRYGKAKIDQMNMILMMLPGVSVTYNGEEIGMLDVKISWNDTKDPAACNSNPAIYEQFTRDPQRTPFQWDDSKNAGFSNATKTWLPVGPNYKEINVKLETAAARSHLKVYKELVKLRNTSTLRNGTLRYKAMTDNILVIERREQWGITYVLVINNSPTPQVCNLSAFTQYLPTTVKVKLANVNSRRNPGDEVSRGGIPLDPYESIIVGSQ